jgi:hypothetical protein
MNHGLKLGAAVTAIALFGAAPAGALVEDLGTSGSVSYLRDRTEVVAPSHLSSGVFCEEGNVSGGGFGGEFSGPQRAFALAPFDSDDANEVTDDGWQGIVYVGAGGAQDLEIYGICAEEKFTHSVSKKVTLDEVGTKSGTATCRNDAHAVSGGAYLFGTIADAYINSTYPTDKGDAGTVPDDAWRTRVHHETTSPLDFRAYVVCAKDPVIYRTTSFESPPAAASLSYVDCRQSEQVLGMGVKASGPAETGRPSNLRPFDNLSEAGTVPDDAVQVQFDNYALSGAPTTVTGYAVCR